MIIPHRGSLHNNKEANYCFCGMFVMNLSFDTSFIEVEISDLREKSL